ncbi:protein of unknown function [Lachnospiraceae bacterium C7]|nr:protein of unknown function [Lachnospiraceae bacterium C7]
MNAKSKILIFNISGEKNKAIHQLCKELKIEVVEVETNDYKQKIGALAHIDGFKKEVIHGTVLDIPGEMLIFSGLNSGDVDKFLAEYRAKKIEPIPLKAVVTPTNITWRANELFKEIVKEHAEMNSK